MADAQSRTRRIHQTGHAYRAIIKRHADEFDAHPEYLGLIKGIRKSGKFCVSNPGLRELVARDAVDYLQKHPRGGLLFRRAERRRGWCECSACAALGSPSDRALALPTSRFDAVAARWPDKFVAFYACNLHAPRPRSPPREMSSSAWRQP